MLAPMSNAPPPPSSDKADFLWRWVFRHLAWFVATFGGLTAMARIPIAHRLVMREARMRLRVLGALVRRLIVAMAAGMEIAAPPERARKLSTPTRDMRGGEPETEDPATWRVHFTIAPGGSMLCPLAESGSTATPPQPFVYFNPFSLKPMARELEAIRRVIADPVAHARRAARMLSQCVMTFAPEDRLARGAERYDKSTIIFQLNEATQHVLDALGAYHARLPRMDSS